MDKANAIEITATDQARAKALLTVLGRAQWGGKDKELEGTEILGFAQVWHWLLELHDRIAAGLKQAPDSEAKAKKKVKA